jgi:hypothetical protein
MAGGIDLLAMCNRELVMVNCLVSARQRHSSGENVRIFHLSKMISFVLWAMFGLERPFVALQRVTACILETVSFQ